MSAFWNFVTRMVPGTLAKAEDVNTNLDGVNTGFNLVEAEINKAIQVTNSPGVVDVTLNAAARANKLLAFDENGDLTTSQIIGDWKGDHADASGTDYEIRDVVKDAAGSIGQDDLYICIATHTSTGDLATDTANWELLVEVSGVAASAAAALVSENNAATSADFLDDRVLGSFSTANEPTLDNDGNALLTGAQYFNTDLDRMKVYTGSAWQLNTAAAADVTIVDSGTVYTATDVEGALQEVKLIADAALPEADVDADIKTLSLPASTTISAYGKTLIDDANAPAAVTTLGFTATAGEVNAICDNKTLASSDDKIDNFPAGTLMLFQQTSAPTGWTKQTTHNNKAFRVVSGTASSGGSVAFTTAFTSKSVSGSVGNTALSIAQMPSHNHTVYRDPDNFGYGTGSQNIPMTTSGTAINTGSQGSGATHTHSFSGTAINMAVQYVDLIICAKA